MNNVGIICRENDMFTSIIKGEMTVTPSELSERLLEAIISGYDDVSRVKIFYSNNPYIQELIKLFSVRFKEHLK